MNNEDKIKFLIIRFSSIGDIVLTTPVVRCLKEQVEGAEVHYLTKPQYVELLKNNPYIDKVHSLSGFNTTITELKNEGFDYLIDLHKNIRSYRFRNKLKILDFTFSKLNREKFLLVYFKINKLPDIHIVDRYFEAVKVFDVNNDNKGLDYFIDNDKTFDVSKELSIDEKFVAFAIGGQHNTKKMPPVSIRKICKRINSKVILLGGKEDLCTGDIIAKNEDNIINLCGKTSLDQSADVIRQADIVISHDTGLMHIAAALKKPIVSVWGNTVPEFGMYPYMTDEKSKIFEVKNIKCRPCSKIGHKKCPKKTFHCMKMQKLNKISQYVNKLLDDEKGV